MRRTERGFTLLELLLSMGVLGVVLATSATVLLHANADAARVNAGAEGIRGLHRALEILEADARGAERVEAGDAETVRFSAGGRAVDWRLEGGVLRRRGLHGDERVASRISGFRVAPEGGLWRISIDLAERTGSSGMRAGATTLVGPRGREEAR